MNFENHSDSRIRQAYKIARAAHSGQVDKADVDYINHPVAVASNVGEDISAIIIALLHDVVEDTGLTFEYLEKNVPLTAEELAALKLLTHAENIPYANYIEKIKTNKLAAKVKIADLKHNSDLSRLSNVTEKDLQRVEKYKKALANLTAALS